MFLRIHLFFDKLRPSTGSFVPLLAETHRLYEMNLKMRIEYDRMDHSAR